MIRKPIFIVAAVLAALAVGTAVIFAKQQSASPEKTEPASVAKPALTVATTQADIDKSADYVKRQRQHHGVAGASIGAEANGLRLTDVRVNVGDQIEKGQILATFAAETIEADVAQAQANLAEAEANAQESAANGDRARRLQPTGAMSAQQINQYLTAERAAQARVQAAKATLNAQQLRMKFTRVVAPDRGVISSRMATVGAVVGAGTELFRMIRQGRLEWRAEVMSEELGRLKPGTPVTVTAANGVTLQGKVRIVAPTVDPQTRAALVYVDLPGDAGDVGMFATGLFGLGASGALTVPQQAVLMRDGFTYVFAVNADQRVAQLKVTTGRRVGDRIEIIAGLKEDELIVASGAGFLNDGDLVKALAQATANRNKGIAMNFSSLSIKYPIPAIMLFALLTIAGLNGLSALTACRIFPISNYRLSPSTASLPGAAPAQLETEVARKIEDSVATLQGVKNIYTKILDGMAYVTVEFNWKKTCGGGERCARCGDADSRTTAQLNCGIRS